MVCQQISNRKQQKIDKMEYVIKNGTKTTEYWDACIRCDHQPLRMKIRNICGDETVFVI